MPSHAASPSIETYMKGYLLAALLIISFLLIGIGPQYYAMAVHELLILVFIVCAAYWYPRYSLLIALSTAAVDLIIHLFSGPISADFFRAGMLAASIIVIGVVVGWLRIESEQHENQYRALFSSMSSAVIILKQFQENGDFVIADINPGAEKMFGVGKNEAAGEPFFKTLPGFEGETLYEVLNRILINGTPENIPCIQYRETVNTVFLSCNIFSLPTREIALICHDISEQIEVSQALRASEAWYRTLLDALNEGVLVIDRDAVTTFVNPVLAKMLGYSRHEMIGKPFFELIDENGRESASLMWEKLKKGLTQQREFSFRKKDGSNLEAITSMAPLYDINGNIAGAIEGILDISYQQELFRKLEESESYYRALFMYSAASILIVDKNGIIIQGNPEFSKLTGFSNEEAIGRNIFDNIAVEDRDLLFSYHTMGEIAPGSVPTTYRVRFVQKDGNYRTVMVHAGMIPGTEYTIVSLIDITEIQRITSALKESEERYREVTVQAQEVIWEVDGEGRLLYINPLSLQVLGYTPEELVSTANCRNLLDPAHAEEYITQINALLGAGHAIHGLLLSIRKKDGHIAWLKINAITVDDEKGTLTGCRGSAIDVTGEVVLREQQEESLRQIELNLYQLARLNDEIRNPLAVIVALADMEGGPNADKIIEQSMKIDGLIRDIDLAWVESVKVRDFLKKYYGIEDVVGNEKKRRIKPPSATQERL